MALNSNKSGFPIDMGEKFKRKQQHTDTDAHTYTDIETKSKRLYLLAKPSVHEKLDRYAKEHGDSFNNLVHKLMEQFIEENGL